MMIAAATTPTVEITEHLWCHFFSQAMPSLSRSDFLFFL